MPIRIEEINVKGMGPITEFSEKLSQVNLFYGKNEQGKTFLVEFILKSLFRSHKYFNLRPGDYSGNVIVSGLDKKLIRFSPGSRDKLEDYLQTTNPGIPPNLSRLLVVKGAELDLDENAGTGISRKIIKSFLSSQTILDNIQGNMSATVKNAVIESGLIVGSNTGELKKRTQSFQQLTNLDDLLDRVNTEFSGGQLSAIQRQSRLLQEQEKSLIKAKRFKAWTLNQELIVIESKIKDLNENNLDQFLEAVKDYDTLQEALKLKQSQLEITREKSFHYEWLQQAIIDYEKLFERAGGVSDNRVVLLAGILIALGLSFLISGLIVSNIQQQLFPGLTFSMIALLPLLAGILIGILQIRKNHKNQSFQVESQELERISESYEQRFDKPLSDIVTLKTTVQAMQADYFKTKSLKEDVEEKKTGLEKLETDINVYLSGFGYKGQKSEIFNEIAEELKEKRSKLFGLENDKKIELAGLLIDPEEYLDIDPGIEYADEILKQIQSDILKLDQMAQAEENQLQMLLTEIKSEVGYKGQITWEDAIDHLRMKRMEIAQEYSTQTSRILASIILNEEINQSRLQEDENIQSNLSSPLVIAPLQRITGHYNSIRMEEDNLKVADKFNKFSMDELSTGAREQVLLALRIGFASKLLGHDSAFLILDDAFQHSDWNRRVNLVQETIELAKNGWQIIYFTMDDHIKFLFDEYGQKKISRNYRSFNLSNESKVDVKEIKI